MIDENVKMKDFTEAHWDEINDFLYKRGIVATDIRFKNSTTLKEMKETFVGFYSCLDKASAAADEQVGV